MGRQVLEGFAAICDRDGVIGLGGHERGRGEGELGVSADGGKWDWSLVIGLLLETKDHGPALILCRSAQPTRNPLNRLLLSCRGLYTATSQSVKTVYKPFSPQGH